MTNKPYTPSTSERGQHTPGPWRVDYPDGYPQAGEDRDEVACVRHNTFGALDVFTPPRGHEWEEHLANAYLIAAAPDLLASLKELFPDNFSTGNPNIPDTRVIPSDVTMGELRRARAAISKATPPREGEDHDADR